MNEDLLHRLRETAKNIRRKPTPLSDVIPLLTEAATRIEMLEAECSALRQQLRQMEYQVYGGVSQ